MRGADGQGQRLYRRRADKPASERHRALPKQEAVDNGRLVAHGFVWPSHSNVQMNEMGSYNGKKGAEIYDTMLRLDVD